MGIVVHVVVVAGCCSLEQHIKFPLSLHLLLSLLFNTATQFYFCVMPQLSAINTQYFEVILPLTRLCSGNELKFGYYLRTGGKAGAILAQELAGEAAPLSLTTTVGRQKSGKGNKRVTPDTDSRGSHTFATHRSVILDHFPQ